MEQKNQKVTPSSEKIIQSVKNRNPFSVIFDMDGVIVNSMPYHKKAWEVFLKKYAPDIELEEFTKHFGKTNRDLLRIVFKREISDEEESRFGEEKEALFRELYVDDIVPTAGLVVTQPVDNFALLTANPSGRSIRRNWRVAAMN